VTFTVTANGKSDSKSADVTVSEATGSIDITVTYVPNPRISSVTVGTAPQACSVDRSGFDATCHAPLFHQGTAYPVTLVVDAAPDLTVTLTDDCGGTIAPPAFTTGTVATGTWTPTAASVAKGACILTAGLTRTTDAGTLSDSFAIVVVPTAP